MKVLGVSFNQDRSLFSLSLTNGFRIYELEPLKERRRFGSFQQWLIIDFVDGGVRITELLYRTNILALVGGGIQPVFPPNKVIIWDDKAEEATIELEFRSEVKAVRLRRDRIVVVLATKVFVYSMEPQPQKLCVFDTALNDKGLVTLGHQSMLAFPGNDPSHVQLVDIGQPKDSSFQSAIIAAHQSEVAQLCIDASGSLLATCSKKGTLVRVFDVKSGRLLHEFRRGVDRADIWTMCFNTDSTSLCVGSDKGTIHIFSLQSTKSNPSSVASPVRSPGNRQHSLSFMKDLLPKYFSSAWSYAFAHISSEARFSCAFGQDQRSILVVSEDGGLYRFGFDPEHGGECTRIAYQKILKD